MKCFDFIVDRIWEELSDAETYIEKALEYKDKNRALSDMLFQLSQQEMAHENMLRVHFVKMSATQELWKHIEEWMHPKITDMEEKIRRMHEMYRM